MHCALQAEIAELQHDIAAGTAAPQIKEMTMVGDRRVQFKLKGFDNDVPGALDTTPLLASVS